MWSGFIDSHFVSGTNTFQECVDAGETELSACEEASTNSVIVAAVRSGMELATEDESDGENDIDPTPDVPCKDVLKYLSKAKMCCAKNNLSDKAFQCLSLVEDEIIQSAVKKHCHTKITAFFH